MPSPHLPPSLAKACASTLLLNQVKLDQAQARLDSLCKPVGSLGRLEEMARQLFAIQELAPIQARPARMFTFAADHGVWSEGVSHSARDVTAKQVANFVRGGGGINCLCDAAGADLRVVDVGVDAPPFQELAGHPRFVDARITRGTANMAAGPAMTLEQCQQALQTGLDLAEEACRDGIRVLGCGEMGVANTTASSALYCAYLGFSPEEMTGMGGGVPPAGLQHKAKVIQKALNANRPALDSGDPVAILAALGGLEIAAITGLIIGGAARRMAVMIDGFIATAAYVAASRFTPAVRGYCYFCHGSAEAGHGKALESLEIRPLLDLGMRLGEGTGAALGFSLLDAAARVYNDMVTLAEIEIES